MMITSYNNPHKGVLSPGFRTAVSQQARMAALPQEAGGHPNDTRLEKPA
jgi:hypothetical protein